MANNVATYAYEKIDIFEKYRHRIYAITDI